MVCLGGTIRLGMAGEQDTCKEKAKVKLAREREHKNLFAIFFLNGSGGKKTQ